tara:strand:- start:4908 stop:5285 length:378 start_codon:yes stop_codon:yes gene_type:complete
MNSTELPILNQTLPLGNETVTNATVTNATVTNATNDTYFDRIVETVYFEIDSMKNSQMIMGAMFLGMVLGMIIMVLCCVKHKQDGYYRVTTRNRSEELELVPQHDNLHKGNLSDARFEIGLDSDE